LRKGFEMRYTVKIIERHSGTIEVEAESREDAVRIAMHLDAMTEFDFLEDAYVVNDPCA
jgi:hypothetical protein